MQQQVQGGFDREIYETLKENRDYSSIAYGDVAPNAFAFNILIDRGEDNQISQTLSTWFLIVSCSYTKYWQLMPRIFKREIYEYKCNKDRAAFLSRLSTFQSN